MSTIKLKSINENTSSVFVVDTEYKVGIDGTITVPVKQLDQFLNTKSFEVSKDQDHAVVLVEEPKPVDEISLEEKVELTNALLNDSHEERLIADEKVKEDVKEELLKDIANETKTVYHPEVAELSKKKNKK